MYYIVYYIIMIYNNIVKKKVVYLHWTDLILPINIQYVLNVKVILCIQ